MTIIIRNNPEFTNLLQNSLKSKYEQNKRSLDEVHVSDILPSTCIRKQYYSRKYPELDPITEESVHHFIRGESSEFIITNLANIGVAQMELEMDGLLARPDIMGKDIIIELKDTLSNKRFDITDFRFKSYLRQLLYYLIITGIENGIISIRYSNREMRWLKSDENGEYFYRPYNNKMPRLESWIVTLPKDDISRELLKNEMMRRKNLFLNALKENDVSRLPRLDLNLRNRICLHCKYYNKCMNEDKETEEAKEMAKEIDLLDISGMVDFRSLEY